MTMLKTAARRIGVGWSQKKMRDFSLKLGGAESRWVIDISALGKRCVVQFSTIYGGGSS